MFREHLRIAWPFDFRDCYTRNLHVGAYGLSPLFKDRLRDLRAWTMEPDFFAQYPELRQDVPQFPGQPSPMDVSTIPAVSRQLAGALTDGVYGEERRDGHPTDRVNGEGGSHGDESEGDLFLADLGFVENNPDFLFFQEALSGTPTSHDTGARLSKHKDSSCISL